MRFLVIFLAIFLFSCNRDKKNEDILDAVNNDSLAIKLNSPELRAINEKILADPENASLYQQRALVYLGMRELPPAVNDSKRAIRLDSTKAEYYLTLADVYFAQ